MDHKTSMRASDSSLYALCLPIQLQLEPYLVTLLKDSFSPMLINLYIDSVLGTMKLMLNLTDHLFPPMKAFVNLHIV